jgi:hypothetical protein
MAMRNEGLQKTFLSAAATAANRILKIGADNNHMIVATAATDKLMAVSDNLGADAAEEPFDVILDGVALVKAGGAIAAGDMITSDATGQGIATTTAANRYIGVAMESAAAGDLFGVRLAPGLI